MFHFGIYPGGMSGTSTGLTSGPPNKPAENNKALTRLQGTAPTFIVRAYAGYHGADKPITIVPEEPLQYMTTTRVLDLVLCFQSNDNDLTGWKNFIHYQIEKYCGALRYLQVTEEANVNLPALDGYFANSRKALVEGIVYARQVVDSMDLNIEVGFNATPDFNPSRQFWKEIRSLAIPGFYQSLNYVGLDFFPDVFRPLPRDANDNNKPVALEPIKQVIKHFRNDMVDAGIPYNIPLHITENGWPTNSTRSEVDQAIVIDAVIRSIYELRSEFNIKTYQMFDLRDADSSSDDIFYRFGIMNDDYQPKHAFETYRKLISELTSVN